MGSSPGQINPYKIGIELYRDIEDLYKLSMYKKGSNPDIDQAIDFHGKLEGMLNQPFGVSVDLGAGFDMLRSRLAGGQP